MKTLDVENFKSLFHKRVLLCVSGGVDSMVLLDAVFRLKNEKHIEVIVCHFEHGIRGAESRADMEFVKDTCNSLGIPVLVRCEDIPNISGGSNVEEVARQRRYAYFYQMLEEHKADYIVLAHHMDDNCETILLHMLRGCGIRGLCGMQPAQNKLIRPLLGYTKAELMEYADENGVKYRLDATNSDCSYLRNSVRNQILPLFLEKNPSFIQSINRMRNIVTDEDDFLENYVADLPWIIERPYGYDIKVSELTNAHSAIKYRSVYYVLRKLVARDIDYNSVETVLALVDKSTGKQALVQNITVYRQPEVLSFAVEEKVKLESTPIKIPGVTELPCGSVVVELAENVSIHEIKDAKKTFAYFTLTGTQLFARARQDGDKVTTFSGHEKKLKDLLIDEKVPVFMRDSIPLICSDFEIIFVPGIVRSNKYPFAETGIRIEYIPKNQ